MKHTFSEPFLGEISALTISTPSLEESVAFYKKLGFYELFRADWPFAWVQVTDGVLLIMLRADPKQYLALTYYVQDVHKVAQEIEAKGLTFEMKPAKSDHIQRYLLRCPGGMALTLVGVPPGFKRPPGPGMLQMDPQDYFKPEKYVNKTIGLFGELAQPIPDLAEAIDFWQLLGYRTVSKYEAPYPWAILTDGLGIVGLHQTGRFSHPAITYFAADMTTKVESLKKDGLSGFSRTEGFGDVLLTPEQQHFFLFHLGMGNKPTQGDYKKVIKTDVIATGRLDLKLVTPEVLRELVAVCDDAYIMEFLGLQDAAELALEKEKVAGGLTTWWTSLLQFQMVDRESGKVVGKCGYHNWYALHRRAELGYSIFREEDKNKGYMKEALTAIIPYGFKQMNLHRIAAFVGPNNRPSLRLMERFGFTDEGMLRLDYFVHNHFEDSRCFGLLADEWKLRNSN